MSLVLAAAGSGRALWYLTRGTGAMTLILLTLSLVLGVADLRWSSRRLPRFVVDGLHRTVSLLVVVVVALHIATSVLDSFAPIRLVDVVVPFVSAYRPVWVGLGALAFDLLVALTVTSLLRARLGYGAWRAVHWLAYACWPVALVHGLGTGSDIQGAWMLAISLGCVAAVVVAVITRLAGGWPGRLRLRLGAAGALAAAGVALALWLPSGPLAQGWAHRAGTPKSDLTPTAQGRGLHSPSTGAR
jgi:sulfoxide reductase heme-binding subunit YedZ